MAHGDGGVFANKAVAVVNARVVTPFREAANQSIVIERGMIAQLGSASRVSVPADAEVIDAGGKLVVPGFIDLHVHGAQGASFDSADQQEFEKICGFLLRHGTTGALATPYPDEQSRLVRTLRALAEYCRQNGDQSVLCGVHLEGPFLNPQMAGAIRTDHIYPPNQQLWRRLYEAGRGYIRLMTIAPEIAGAVEVMQAAAQEQVVLSVAHSLAAYEDIEVAVDNGLSQVTHIFNAMQPMHHRNPGVLVGALLKKELKVQLIADGVHVHPAVMELLYKIKGSDGIILITDATRAAGLSDGQFEFAGQKVQVKQGRALTEEGTLAGSTITLEKAVKVMVRQVGIPVTEAVRMASLNPARVLGLDHRKGVLAVGKDADMVVLDDDFEVEMTIIRGRIAYRRER